jgi:hypothetical protein
MRDTIAIFTNDLSTLIVQGLIWDTVKDVISLPFQSLSIESSSVTSTPEIEIPRILFEQNAYPSERDFVQSLWQTCLIPSDTTNIFHSEDNFIAFGLSDVSNPITKTLYSPHQRLFTPRILNEMADLGDHRGGLF